MPFDAIVLSGGRAARLGGAAKAALLHHGVPLVVRAAEAASGARGLVVVGDGAAGLPARARVIRESPPFSGPAAALGAGLRELDRLHGPLPDETAPEFVLVLACDMPGVGRLVGPLLTAAAADGVDGAVAVDASGRPQPLAAVYRRWALRRVVGDRDLVGTSMRDVLSGLRLAELPAPDGATADVDTWSDAERLEVERAEVIGAGCARERE